MNLLTQELLNNADKVYRDFSKKLIPDTKYEIIGVRVPVIKNIAKKFINNEAVINDFLLKTHNLFEEWFLHGIIIANLKFDVKTVFDKLDNFLQYLDNWSVCDSTSSALKIIKQNKAFAYERIVNWTKSNNPYTIRFAITLLLNYFIEDQYIDEIFSLINKLDSNNYYVNMAIAWFYSVCLVKKYDKTLHLFTENRLKDFIHNKSIQKAVESFRIPENKKQYLKTLRRKKL